MRQEENNYENYLVFADYYNLYISMFDLSEWFNYLKEIKNKFSIAGRDILDCGCGTGMFSIEFAKLGYNVTAVDSSIQMLSIADMNTREKNVKIRFINDEIENYLSFQDKYSFIYASNDVINYLDEACLQKMFFNMYNMMEAGAVFTFDMLGANISRKQSYRIAENTYVNFNRRRIKDVLYTKVVIKDSGRTYEENHVQYLYGTDNIEKLAAKAGFRDCKFYDIRTFNRPSSLRGKIQIVLSKKLK